MTELSSSRSFLPISLSIGCLIGCLTLLAPPLRANPLPYAGDHEVEVYAGAGEVYPGEVHVGDGVFIDTLGSYMDVSEKLVSLAGDRETTIFFAIEGIVEIYERRNELAKAPAHLDKILRKYPDNQTIRNIVRFKLRDVYNDTGQSDMALRELEAIIAEN